MKKQIKKTKTEAAIAQKKISSLSHRLAKFQIRGKIEGTGTHFKVKNSDCLNITLESTKLIKVVLESMPEMVTLRIEPTSRTPSTSITISGFMPLTTYYKYEDNYHNQTAFKTDKGGKYSYKQDISSPHLVFFQPRPSTIYLTATGWSQNVGTWNGSTATLTQNVNETIEIDVDNVTLDGNNYTITGNNLGGLGILLSGRTGITIKNVKICDFQQGIYLYNSDKNAILQNTISHCITGIHLDNSSDNNLDGNTTALPPISGVCIVLAGSHNNTLRNNTLLNPDWGGISLHYSNNNIISDNTANSCNQNGISLYYSNNNHLEKNITNSNNTTVGWGGIWLEDSTRNRLNDNTANYNSNGIVLIRSENNTLKKNTAVSNWAGIYLSSSSKNILESNITNSNSYGTIVSAGSNNNAMNENTSNSNSHIGFYVLNTAGNSLIKNETNENGNRGIMLTYSSSTKLTGNTASKNLYGIYLLNSGSNTLSSNTTLLNTKNGISLDNSGNNTLRACKSSLNSSFGICLLNSSNTNTVKNNACSRNLYGIGLKASSQNTIRDNTANKNSKGIYLYTSSNNNNLFHNIVSINYYGIYLSLSITNKLIHNNFINNFQQASVTVSGLNVFFQTPPTGGNYWNDWTSPDLNNDGWVDYPYLFTGGQDNYPSVNIF